MYALKFYASNKQKIKSEIGWRRVHSVTALGKFFVPRQSLLYMHVTCDALKIVPNSVMFYYCIWYDF